MSARHGILAGLGVSALAVLAFAMPAVGAPGSGDRSSLGSNRSKFASFTPASADPRLAAVLSRAGFSTNQLRFTPVAAIGRNRAVTVAVRARRASGVTQTVAVAPSASVGVAPVAYDLGVGVGWKRFALTGDVRRVDTALAPGSRKSADVGISYNAPKWSTRVQVAADRPVGNAPRTIVGGDSLSLDVGGAYRITRNLDVTAGVRYRSERNRIDRIEDDRRDSQAVYVGTAFRF
jgi:hypothetical protein